MGYADDDFRQVIEDIWTSILGLEKLFQTSPVPEGDDQDLMCCCVHITGAWDGVIVLECSEPLLRHAAAVMFGTTAETIDSVSMTDALGELTNMIGGNIKSLLPGRTARQNQFGIEVLLFGIRIPRRNQPAIGPLMQG